MRLLVINLVAINIDRIDGIVPNIDDSNYTCIYVSGSDEPFTVKARFEDVLDMINNLRDSDVGKKENANEN